MQFVLKICNSNKINQVLYEVVHVHFYREIKRAILPISLAIITNGTSKSAYLDRYALLPGAR